MAQATPPVPYTPSLDPLEPEIERRGALALAPPTAIAKIASIADLAAVVADSHRTMVVLGPMLFSLRAEQDAKTPPRPLPASISRASACPIATTT